jgi:hypothetical protein
MDVPMNVIEAVAPEAVDCMAESPLHPLLESLRVHAPVNVTAASDSSTRLPAAGIGGPLGSLGAEGVDAVLPAPPPPPPQEDSSPASNDAMTNDV